MDTKSLTAPCVCCYKKVFLESFIAESVSEFFKPVNNWQRYRQERDCLAYFPRLLASG